jgi:hypothetical protein
MRKLLSYFAVLVLGLSLGLSHLALANHVNEPTHPISSFELTIEDYANNDPIDCVGETVTFRKFRIEPIAESDEAWVTGVPGHHDPSEHFSTGWQLDRRVVDPVKGTVSWVMEERAVWAHSNIPGDTDSTKFNVAYATITPGQPNGGSSTVLGPGTYRLTAELLADVSENHFVEVCTWTVS